MWDVIKPAIQKWINYDLDMPLKTHQEVDLFAQTVSLNLNDQSLIWAYTEASNRGCFGVVLNRAFGENVAPFDDFKNIKTLEEFYTNKGLLTEIMSKGEADRPFLVTLTRVIGGENYVNFNNWTDNEISALFSNNARKFSLWQLIPIAKKLVDQKRSLVETFSVQNNYAISGWGAQITERALVLWINTYGVYPWQGGNAGYRYSIPGIGENYIEYLVSSKVTQNRNDVVIYLQPLGSHSTENNNISIRYVVM